MLQVLVTISLKILLQKGAMQVIHKIQEEIELKMDKCPRYLKQWVLRCPPEKKEIDE